MVVPQYRTLSKRIIDRLPGDDKDAVFWTATSPDPAFGSTLRARRSMWSRAALSAA